MAQARLFLPPAGSQALVRGGRRSLEWFPDRGTAMPLRSDKKTLQGQVQPWRCDLCGEPFEPDLKAICTRCGRLCCPEHRAESGAVCTDCSALHAPGDKS